VPFLTELRNSFCSTFSTKMSPRTGLEKRDRPEP
jgi:hypothetical protein